MDTYTKAKTELSEIDSQIAALQQRKAILRQFIELGAALYGEGGAANPARAVYSMVIGMAAADQSQVAAPQREGTAKGRILEAAVQHISENGPKQTRELLSALEATGIEVGGADKVNSLSVILSKSGLFQANRTVGWTLIERNKEEAPSDAPTSAGPSVGEA